MTEAHRDDPNRTTFAYEEVALISEGKQILQDADSMEL